MTEDGLVSVIIPTYNRAELCSAAVDSVLAQSYRHLEVIVVDDGSSDHTESLLAGRDPRVRYVRQQNQGVSAARNHGFRLARGEFVALLDSDDCWLPFKLELQLAVLRRFPQAGMVWSDMTAVDERGAVLHQSYLKKMYGAYRYFEAERDFSQQDLLERVWQGCPRESLGVKCFAGAIFQWMFLGNLVHTSTVLLRAARREQVGEFDASLIKSGEDYDFHLRTCHKGAVAYVDLPTINYRVGAGDQLTAPSYAHYVALNNLTTVTRIFEEAGAEIRALLPHSLIRRRLAKCQSWVGMTEFWSDRLSARSHFRKSLAYFPFQSRVMLFYMLTVLPAPVTEALRRLKNELLMALGA